LFFDNFFKKVYINEHMFLESWAKHIGTIKEELIHKKHKMKKGDVNAKAKRMSATRAPMRPKSKQFMSSSDNHKQSPDGEGNEYYSEGPGKMPKEALQTSKSFTCEDPFEVEKQKPVVFGKTNGEVEQLSGNDPFIQCFEITDGQEFCTSGEDTIHTSDEAMRVVKNPFSSRQDSAPCAQHQFTFDENAAHTVKDPFRTGEVPDRGPFSINPVLENKPEQLPVADESFFPINPTHQPMSTQADNVLPFYSIPPVKTKLFSSNQEPVVSRVNPFFPEQQTPVVGSTQKSSNVVLGNQTGNDSVMETNKNDQNLFQRTNEPCSVKDEGKAIDPFASLFN